MKFLADENVPRPLTRLMVERGHDVVFVKKGSLDTAIFARAKKEGLLILTNDTDFLDTGKFPLVNTPGRIVLRIFPTIFAFQRERFDAFLTNTLPTLEISGRLIVVSANDVVERER